MATALWTLHSLEESYWRPTGNGDLQHLPEESIGVSADGRAELMGVGLCRLCMLGPGARELHDNSWDLEQFGKVLHFLLASPFSLEGSLELSETASQPSVALGWPQEVAELIREMADQCRDIRNRSNPNLQGMVTRLAHVLIEYDTAEQSQPLAQQTTRWALLRNVLRACWAFQGSLEALCCVCLEPSEKGKGLLCPLKHKNPLLCCDCLEPYVCSLIGTSELRRLKGLSLGLYWG